MELDLSLGARYFVLSLVYNLYMFDVGTSYSTDFHKAFL